MVGRHQSDKGINETILHKLDPHEINYNDVIKPGENIYILSHQPGIGKTHSLMEWIKSKIESDDSFKFFYFTDRHDSIYEHLDKWNISNVSHWEGFERTCDNSRMKNLSKYHLSAIDICNQCNKCNTYRNQFKDANRVFAPFQYLQTNHFNDNYPSVFILDETIKQYTKYFPDYAKAKDLLNVMGLDELVDLVDNDLKKLYNELSKDSFKDKYKEFIVKLISNKSSNRTILQLIEEFNIFNFIQYLKWDNFYSYHFKFYGMPMLYYHAFNAVANGIPAIFMDATFNPFFFHYLLETYNVEGKIHSLTPFTSLNLYHYYKRHQNYHSVLYRLKPEDTLPKASFTNPQFWERTKEWFPSYMKAIMGTV